MTVVAPGQITLMNSLMSSSPSPLMSPTAKRASISLLVNLEPDFLISSWLSTPSPSLSSCLNRNLASSTLLTF